MSDTFDHWCDAYENYEYDESYGYSGFDYNPLYHHVKTSCKILTTTNKATLLKDNYGEFWIPSKLIKMENNFIYIWENFNPSYINQIPDLIDGDIIEL